MDELIEKFCKFPGIGKRQANRFVSFLMHTNTNFRNDLIKNILSIDSLVSICNSCNRTFLQNNKNHICNICEKNKNAKKLIIVAYDNDVDVINKTLTFDGLYFVLGSYIPLFDEQIDNYVNISKLFERIDIGNFDEIIIALNATQDGDFTAKIIKDVILKKYIDINITTLGRGITTGGEIEYIDSETLREALKRRI